MQLALPLVFMILMGLAMLAYVILDGFDLGVGILLPFAARTEQDVMVSSIGPFWDANETWLVLGVGILLVAFPKAHGIILTALYLPVAAMLVFLIPRGVSFEFRLKATGWHREVWNRMFFVGSLGAALAYSLFPYLIVDRMTIWQAAAARESLSFVFVGTCIVLPMIVAYTVFAYRVFWGKARELTYGDSRI